MGINEATLKAISENSYKFSEVLNDSIEKLISFALEFSPLSDISYILDKSKFSFPRLKFELSKNSWVPVRNVIRIIAKVSEEEANKGEISEIQINDMHCGCDYFEGYMSYTLKNIGIKVGRYKWQWTAFPGRERHYNKFNQFPNELMKIEKVTN